MNNLSPLLRPLSHNYCATMLMLFRDTVDEEISPEERMGESLVAKDFLRHYIPLPTEAEIQNRYNVSSMKALAATPLARANEYYFDR